MSNVISIDSARATLHKEIAAVVAFALESVIDLICDLKSLRDGSASGDEALYWPLSHDLCMRLIVQNAEALRPSLKASGAERRIFDQVWAEMQSAVARSLSTARGQSAPPRDVAG